MKILHLLSQNSLTGAEVYANDLAKTQIAKGHQVYQASNGFFSESQAQRLTLPIETKSIFEFRKTIQKLSEFIQTEKIQVIHAHSRAASKVAYQLAKKHKVGYVSTVHGRQHVSWSKKIKNIYGHFTIPVCENIQKQLVQEFGYDPRRIKLVRNGIQIDKFNWVYSQTPQNNLIRIGIIGRLNGPKKTRTELFIQHFSEILIQKKINFQITVIGSGQLNPDLIHHPIQQIDHRNVDSDLFKQFDLICGSGRVAMESILCGIPTIAFGEAEYCGLVTMSNWPEMLKSNFGDIGESFADPIFNIEKANQDIDQFWKFSEIEKRSLAIESQSQFDLSIIGQKIQRIYESAYFEAYVPKWIPVLMYHKIPDQDLNSPHKIYVNKNNFEKHLKFFKQAGFTSLTFQDLQLYRQGQKDFSQFPKKPLILTFDDGYIDNLTNARPLLEKYGFKAQIYLLANPQIESNTWDQWIQSPSSADAHSEKHLIASQQQRLAWKCPQFEIGSHGLNHQRMPDMTWDEKIFELSESKRLLEAEFGTTVNSFAFTYGATNLECAKACQEAGYDYGINTDSGGLTLEEDPFQIFRVNIFPHETLWTLWRKTSSWYRSYYFRKRKK